MRCSKAHEYLSMEMDGILPADATVDLEKHLDSCSECRQYREEIRLGSRFLAATAPSLSENFDWKLQLRLNQTLKETAGEVAYPWTERSLDRWGWFRSFGTAAAMGMAAVLALAVFLGPIGDSHQSRAIVPVSAGTHLGGDRLPLENSFQPGRGLIRPVSSRSPFQNFLPRSASLGSGWSGQDIEDLRTIYRLRSENEKLGKMLFHTQRQLQLMRAQLDSTAKNALDLNVERR